MTPKATVIQGDCVEVMRGMDAESVHAIVTDPPYGLSKPPDIAEVLGHWLKGDDAKAHEGKVGFMGAAWDGFVPGPATWREAYRVLKPGGYLLAFAGSRTFDLMGMSIRLAGFEIRDSQIWLYGSGFPKSHNVSKEIDKAAGAEREVVGYDASRARPNRLYESGAIGNIGGNGTVSDRTDNGATLTASATPEAAEWEGWGTALKPAQEPIIVARKPLIGTVVENVLQHGTGGLHIDACRVGADVVSTHSRGTNAAFPKRPTETTVEESGRTARQDGVEANPHVGRWPPNTLLSHVAPEVVGGCYVGGCQKIGTRTVKGDGHFPATRPAGSQTSGPSGHVGQDNLEESYTGEETVETWACVPGCPIPALDAQSGAAGAAAPASSPLGVGRHDHGIYQPAALGFRTDGEGSAFYGDKGGASRFFPQLNFDPEFDGPPFFYSAKTSRSEREAGCDNLPIRNLARSDGAQAAENAGADTYTGGSQGIGLNHVAKVRNNHPTCKNVALMRWLLRLVMPPGGVGLDPFLGSGTTGMAALYEGFDFIGIEQDENFVEIAKARIAWVEGGGKLKEKKPAKTRKPKAGDEKAAKPRKAKAATPAQVAPAVPAPEPARGLALDLTPAKGPSAFLARMRAP